VAAERDGEDQDDGVRITVSAAPELLGGLARTATPPASLGTFGGYEVGLVERAEEHVTASRVLERRGGGPP
jgi:hypothetical protein